VRASCSISLCANTTHCSPIRNRFATGLDTASELISPSLRSALLLLPPEALPSVVGGAADATPDVLVGGVYTTNMDISARATTVI
jgi:hypothetical protein